MQTQRFLDLLNIPNLSAAIDRSGLAMGRADNHQLSVIDLAVAVELDLNNTNLLVDTLVEGKVMERAARFNRNAIEIDGVDWVRSTIRYGNQNN